MAEQRKTELGWYYKNLFPAELLTSLLSCNNGANDETYFSKREFTLVIGEAYARYQSYQNAKEFREALESKKPDKIDIGPVYTHPPNKKYQCSVGEFYARERELIFDIDLTDYNDVRLCKSCKSAENLCNGCWQLAMCAAEVLDYLLGEMFGAEKRMWVFSGRRGVHCWVLDDKFKQLNVDARSAIVNFMSIYKGKEEKESKISLNSKFPHPTFALGSRVFSICEKYFESIFVSSWKVLDESPEVISSCLAGEDKTTAMTLLSKLHEESYRGKKKWEVFKREIDRKYILLDIVYSLVYPRIDTNVSIQVNHLLKSPFCIHPGTGLVSIPFDIYSKEAFNPTKDAPSLQEILEKKDEAKFKKGISVLKKFVKEIYPKVESMEF